MFKNVASQKIALFAFDYSTGAPKTGDAGNITAYVSKDHGTVTVLGDTSATEFDATNAKGLYWFDLTQSETNGDTLMFSAKSTTANVTIVPQILQTVPASFTAFVTPTGAAVNATQLAGQTITAAAGVTFPSSVASPTNITAGTITTTTNLTNAATAGDFTATMKTSIGTAVAASAVASVTGNVGGNVTGSVGSVASGGISSASFAAGAINAAAIATNAIDADAIATDAVTEIQSGLSTLTAAGVRSAVGLASANLDTQLGAIDDFIDTEVAAIKTTTDHLATALELDSGNYRFTTAALAQAPTGGSAPTAASIADAVWDEAIAGHLSAGSTGLALNTAESGSNPADIADAVWDEQISDHQGAGSTGLALNDAGGSGNPWNAVLEGPYTGGDLLRITAAVAAGKTTIVKQSGGAEVTFRDVTDSSDIVVAEMTKSNRTTVTLAP